MVEEQYRFKSKWAIYLTAALCLIGTIVAIIAFEQTISTQNPSFGDCLIRGIYVAMFVCLMIYILKPDKGSKYFFRTLLSLYALTILLTGLIFPYRYGCDASDKIAALVNASIYGGIFVFYYNWHKFNLSKWVIITIAAGDLALSIWYIAINPMLLQGEFAAYQIAQILLRPLAIIAIGAAYYFRLKEKIAEEKNK